MGCWLFFKGTLQFNKEVTPELKEKVNNYVRNDSWKDPDQPYGTMCPWIIDDNNELSIEAVKFFDHEVWLDYLYEKFFKPEGYVISGRLTFRGEGGNEESELIIGNNEEMRMTFCVVNKPRVRTINQYYII